MQTARHTPAAVTVQYDNRDFEDDDYATSAVPGSRVTTVECSRCFTQRSRPRLQRRIFLHFCLVAEAPCRSLPSREGRTSLSNERRNIAPRHTEQQYALAYAIPLVLAQNVPTASL